MLNLSCNTELQIIHKGGGINFVRKNLVTDFLLVMRITGLVVPQDSCPNSQKSK